MSILIRKLVNAHKSIRLYSSLHLNLSREIEKLQTNVDFRDYPKYYGDPNQIVPATMLCTFKDRYEFLNVYPEVIQPITSGDSRKGIDDFKERVQKLVEYLIVSRLNRGILVYTGYRDMCDRLQPFGDKEENLRLAKFVGWCLEFTETYVCIYDDFVDLSERRRGMPCWYRMKNNGMMAMYDSMYMNSIAYYLLKKFFGHHPGYVRAMEHIQEVYNMVHLGQVATFFTDLNLYTHAFYKKIVQNKTESFMYYLPLALSLCVANNTNQDFHDELKEITVEMGYLFQIQNDFYDAYGNDAISGKTANDISQGTSTWLITEALAVANNAQKVALHAHYGKDEREAVTAVYDVYKELNIPGRYKAKKQQMFNELRTQIANGSDILPRDLLMRCLRHASTGFLDNITIEQ